MKITKSKFIALALAGFAAVGALFAPSVAFATTDVCDANLPPAVLEANGCKSTSATKGTLENTITNILKIVIGASGTVAVISVVIGGIQYMTSVGDVGKVKKAKDTILYALIGIIICALSFAIVNWVIDGPINGNEATENGSTQVFEEYFTDPDN